MSFWIGLGMCMLSGFLAARWGFKGLMVMLLAQLGMAVALSGGMR